MKPIQTGELIPDIVLEDTQEREVRLSELRGKKILLSWHPIAWTGVCTDQMRALEVHYDEFEALGVLPFGVSVDPAAGKKAWAAILSLKKLPLLCDFWPHGKAARDLGIFIEDFGMSERANILLDGHGVAAWVKVYPIGELPDIREVLEAAARL